MKPHRLIIPLLLVLVVGAVAGGPGLYHWYLALRYPQSPRPATGSTNWAAPAGSVARAVRGDPNWAASELPMTRQEADARLRSPVASSPQSIEEGRRLYLIYCAVCHGVEGLGDGPVARRAQFPPPSLPLAAGRRSEGFLYATIRNGGAIMPSFGHAMAPAERWAVVNFLKSIAREAPTVAAQPAAPGAIQEQSSPAPSNTLAGGDPSRGEKIFDDHCSICHAADSEDEIVGPGLKNLMNWPAHRGADGSQHDRHTVPMLRKQIIDGGGAMAPMGDQVKGQDLEDLLAYLQTL